MDLHIEGKVALVCAASKGLGRGAARSLAREGARVAIAARGREALEDAAAEMGALAVRADLTVESDRERLVAEVTERLGPVGILVNNAGGPPPGPFERFGLDDWRDAMELNLVSAVHVSGLVLPEMKQRGWGRIVNIVSIAALETVDDLILSNASRPAVLGWARALSRQVASSGVGVVSVCPGYFFTDRVRDLMGARAEREGTTIEELTRRKAETVPARRMGRPEELGDLVAYLASPLADYVNGSVVSIDGGLPRRIG
jgi:3-oxoacyl-[acyl-carrier protein] reductase